MAHKHSKFGPAPRTPSCMQRSYLLLIDFKVTSLTEWAAQLKINPLYAILSGFEVDDTPGVGTFYDFINRLWDSVEKVTVAELLTELENTEFHLDDQPYASLLKIYKKEFLDTSVSNSLIHPDSFALAGDYRKVSLKITGIMKKICKWITAFLTNFFV